MTGEEGGSGVEFYDAELVQECVLCEWERRRRRAGIWREVRGSEYEMRSVCLCF